MTEKVVLRFWVERDGDGFRAYGTTPAGRTFRSQKHATRAGAARSAIEVAEDVRTTMAEKFPGLEVEFDIKTGESAA